MRILHTSDLHGDWKLPIREERDFDLWVDTGDFFPNITRGFSVEPAFQRAWFTTDRTSLKKRFRAKAMFWPSRSRVPPFDRSIAVELTRKLKGRPVISVSGNHDWVNLADMLNSVGYKNAWNVEKGPIKFGGLKFAGFREVPFVTGEWKGELEGGVLGLAQARPIVAAAMAHDPDVLVTHTPPHGILDVCPGKAVSGAHAGMPELTHHLFYRPNRVRAHLFGHIHEKTGRVEHGGILFSNAAEWGRIIEVEK